MVGEVFVQIFGRRHYSHCLLKTPLTILKSHYNGNGQNNSRCFPELSV